MNKESLGDDLGLNRPEVAYNEFRSRFAAVFENNAILNATVARIETTITFAQEQLYRQMAEMAGSLKSIAVVSNDLHRLQTQMDAKQHEHSEFREREENLAASIIKISEQVEEISELKRKIKLDEYVSFVTIFLNVVFIGVLILHMMYG